MGVECAKDKIMKIIQKNELLTYGNSSVTFVIGSSLGLHQEVLKRFKESISFSKMTFPHQLFKVMLLEKIYRSFRINNNEPYKK